MDRNRSLFAISVAAAAIFALAAAVRLPAQTRRFARTGIRVFQHENFRGRTANFRRDVPDLRRYGMNDRISSLRVPRGEAWEACEHPYYEGRCQVFSGSEPDLHRLDWEDRISSLRRVRPGPPEGYPPAGESGLILYSDSFFRGELRRLRAGVDDLRRIDFDDRTESVRVGNGTWELCEHPGFRNCRLVDRDWQDLREIGFSRKISSARPAPPRWRE